ncbi:hypothetical protein [Verrucomicrobium sp. BvORR106]|uniref:hypothetical protein n=1 Tax=Verrucomicrobium sp. BvORR106 TaxID=1403819 RepID=UPI000AC815AE|nr:hypothetical protein [Verrucomicrobium sp. BvORR106]
MKLPLESTSARRCLSLGIIVLFVCVGHIVRAEPPPLSAKGKAAFEVLKGAPSFSSTTVGIAGITPNEVFAFRDLLDEPKADEAFKVLLNEATPEGKLYAVCALWFTDPTEFQTQVKRLKDTTMKVNHVDGCERGEERVSRLLWSPEAGAVRLKDSQQTIKEWLEANKPANLFYDIGGGAWSSLLRDEGGFRKPLREPAKR